jgi:hypothetical protein
MLNRLGIVADERVVGDKLYLSNVTGITFCLLRPSHLNPACIASITLQNVFHLRKISLLAIFLWSGWMLTFFLVTGNKNNLLRELKRCLSVLNNYFRKSVNTFFILHGGRGCSGLF